MVLIFNTPFDLVNIKLQEDSCGKQDLMKGDNSLAFNITDIKMYFIFIFRMMFLME